MDKQSLSIIDETVSKLNSILIFVEENFTVDRTDFFRNNRIFSLGKYIPIVSDLFHSLKLTEYEQLKNYFKISSFNDLRTRWNNFLLKIDEQKLLTCSQPTNLPIDVQLFSANTGQWIDLNKIYSNHQRTLFVFLRHLA